ncbi:MAG: winged helix-turn-helix transcriptional regulator [Nanoarchaeota archaeon]|nr:winged helix-turn-helix transcriptional regulator [Nanoarchaeota archaeon]
MTSNRELLEALISPSTLKILKLFINNEDQRYYLREIAKLTRIPAATTYRVLNHLHDIGLVDVEQIKRFKLYTLNSESSRFLLDILQDRKSAVVEFVNSIQSFDGVQMVVLHGKEEKDKANVLVIGMGLDVESIKRNAVYMSDKFKFNIILLVLSPDQYNQMSSMGLYPGRKKILFEAESS